MPGRMGAPGRLQCQVAPPGRSGARSDNLAPGQIRARSAKMRQLARRARWLVRQVSARWRRCQVRQVACMPGRSEYSQKLVCNVLSVIVLIDIEVSARSPSRQVACKAPGHYFK